ncbi:MAG: hypothetical protein KC619_03870 [Myxococcales bacterium]|nr:hypothetical protein [Myxococcales bacterium]
MSPGATASEGGAPTLSEGLSTRVHELSDETLALVREAFREGQRAGAAYLGEELAAYLGEIGAELEAEYEGISADLAASVEAIYASLAATTGESAILAAHFGGAGDVLERVRGQLRRLVTQGEASS